MEELFRFMTIGPLEDGAKKSVEVETSNAASTFQEGLAEDLESDDARAAMQARAQALMSSDRFIARIERGVSALAAELVALRERLLEHEPRDVGILRALVAEIFVDDARTLSRSEELSDVRARLGDSLVALSIVGGVEDVAHADLLVALRMCELVERLGAEDPALEQPWAIDKALEQTIRLPPELFPLPRSAPSVSGAPSAIDRTEPISDKEDRARRADVLRKGLRELRAAFAAEPVTIEPVMTRAPDEEDVVAAEERPSGLRPWVFSAAAAERISAATAAVVDGLGLSLVDTPVPEIAEAMDDELIELDASTSLTVEPGSDSSAVGPAVTGEAFTTGQGGGAFRAIGIADLMVVKQRLKRYEKGEIAHIENVLKGESKKRTHRRAKTTEETYARDEETIEETEEDLKSSNRFEMQRETQKTIKEDHTFDSTLTAKYGTAVKVTAKYGYKQSSDEVSKAANRYARDITQRAASKVAERVREAKTRTLVQEVEETNVHEVINTSPDAAHVVGMYRYLDKVYDAQVYSYGQRLMFEFVIPEPAAFAIFADKSKPVTVDGVTLTAPQPPLNKARKPLRPGDITPNTYQDWVARYEVASVSPPPPKNRYVPYTFKTSQQPQNEGDLVVDHDAKELKIPPGYLAESARGTVQLLPRKRALHPEDDPRAKIVIGTKNVWVDMWTKQYKYFAVQLGHHPDAAVPIVVSAMHRGQLSVSIEVLCTRTSEKYATWQHKTYDAIIAAYNDLRSQYEDSVAASAIGQGITITGKNPKINRQRERSELKKGAIVLLTEDISPHLDFVGSIDVLESDDTKKDKYKGHPEVDFAEAAREGPYIQFLEQAFEWAQMSYVFYPYFWARKKRWVGLSQLDDKDPLYSEFLRAGSARVLIPVRPGYEDSVMYFLETKEIWRGSGPPSVGSSRYVSIVESLKEKQGHYFADRKGTVAVVKGSTSVTGTGTAFANDDADREIMIAGKRYRIATVQSPTQLTLRNAYTGTSDPAARYAMGLKLIGEPWDVDVATSLVLLQDGSELPTWE